MAIQAPPRCTIDEYLKLERAAETRSEYLQGAIVPMEGGSRNHGRIASEALARLGGQLRGRKLQPGHNASAGT